MSDHFPLLMVDPPNGTATLTVSAPYDAAPIAEVDTADERHVEKALDAAYALFRRMPTCASAADDCMGGPRGIGGSRLEVSLPRQGNRRSPD